MKTTRVHNVTRGITILEKAYVADSFFLRLKGLLGRRELPPGEGLVIVPCNSIHTVGMAFPIDAAFVDAGGVIRYLEEGMPPSRVGKRVKGARYVIEGPAGLFSRTGTEAGDRVEFRG